MRYRPPAGSGDARDAGSDYFSPATPRVLAHRGFARHAPENTLGAFQAAIEFGFGYLETDVHASRDGVAVLSHDRDLLRMAGRAVRVSA